jgi:WD40 repeat protein
MDFSSDDKTLASAGRDCRVRIWDWPQAKRLKQLRLPQESSFVRISGKNLIFEMKDEITTWQLQPFQESKDAGLPEKRDLRAALGKTGKIISPDGKLSLRNARGESFSLELWDEVAGKLICVKEGNFGNFTAFAFSPDSRILAAGTREGSISLYDTESLRGK